MSLNVQAISKKFDQFTAVEPLSFNIQPGEIVGFLGPNGAGKSTTLKMIAGCLSPDAGAIQLSGMDVQKDEVAYKKMIGYLPESNPLYEDLFVVEYLSFLANAHAITAPTKRIQEVIAQTGLQSMQQKKIGHLSKGFKQRVGIAAAILHAPKLILLDEPTAGMSKSETSRFINLIKEVTVGKTLLTVEHDMGVVFGLADKIAVVVYGEVIAFDTPEAVRSNPRVQEAYLGSHVADAQVGGH